MNNFIEEVKELDADITSVINQIEVMRGQLSDAGPDGEADRALFEQLQSSLRHLTNQADQLLRRISDAINGLIAQLRDSSGWSDTGEGTADKEGVRREIAALQVLAARIGFLISQAKATIKMYSTAIWTSARTFVQKATRIMKALAAHIRRISARLFNLIVGLLTPKEWKIRGDLDLTLFGLAKGGAEITFGPSAGP